MGGYRASPEDIACASVSIQKTYMYVYIHSTASVRKATKRDLEYASVGDFLQEMHKQLQSENARKKRRHLEHWMKEWPKQFNWKKSDWGSFSELRPTHGGGRDGFGATERACMDIFQQCK